jgi:hypothetical protein
MELFATLVLGGLGAYVALGACVALWLVLGGISRLDHAAAGAGLGFRLIITPGLIALWPWAAWRWLARGPGDAIGAAR